MHYLQTWFQVKKFYTLCNMLLKYENIDKRALDVNFVENT